MGNHESAGNSVAHYCGNADRDIAEPDAGPNAVRHWYANSTGTTGIADSNRRA